MQRLFAMPPAALAFSTLMGCAQPKAPAPTVQPELEQAAPSVDTSVRLDCLALADVIGAVNHAGLPGDMLRKPSLQNSFLIAHSSAAEYRMIGGTAAAFFGELQAARPGLKPADQARLDSLLDEIQPQQLALDELTLLCGDKMEHVEGLTLDIAEFTIAPLTPADPATVRSLLSRYGLAADKTPEQLLGGRVVAAVDKPDSDRLVIVHFHVKNTFDLEGYRQTLARLHAQGVKRFVMPSWGGPLEIADIEGAERVFLDELARADNDVSVAFDKVTEQYPQWSKANFAFLLALKIAETDAAVETMGTIDLGGLLLLNRLFYHAGRSNSPQIGRYFAYKGFQVSAQLASQQFQAVKEWALPDKGPNVVHVVYTSSIYDLMLLAAMGEAGLSTILVESA